MSYSKVVLLGNLVRRPEAKGKLVVGTIAVNRSFKKNDKWQKEVSFVPFTSFKETLLECDKGDKLMLDGELVQRNWETKQGEKRSELIVQVQTWRHAGNPKPKPDADDGMSNLDDTPF